MGRPRRRSSQKETPEDHVVMPKLESSQLVKMVKTSGGYSTIEELEGLVTSYLSELENSVHECLSDSKTTTIKHRLIFFSSVYRMIPEPKDSTIYFSKMAELLALYIRLELLQFKDISPVGSPKGGKERENMVYRIVSILYSALDNSEEHVLDTILRVKSPERGTCRKEIKLYSTLYSNVLTRGHYPISDLNYIRRTLLFVVWKKMVQDNENEKEYVRNLAYKHLRPPPGFLERFDTLHDLIPKPPDDVENITEFFIKEKFNVKETLEKFREFVSKAAADKIIFPRLSEAPRILNRADKVLGPLPDLDGHVEDFPSDWDPSSSLWEGLLRTNSTTEQGLYAQVTCNTRKYFQSKSASTRVLNFLRLLYNKDHSQKDGDKASRKGLSSQLTKADRNSSAIARKRKSEDTGKERVKEVCVRAPYDGSSGLRTGTTSSLPYVAIPPYTGNG